jgi:hypothetical protein
MGFVLTLRDDTEIVDFLSEEYQLLDGGLKIDIPEQKEVWGGDSIYAQGAQLVQASFGNRQAEIKFNITGLTRDELIQNVARIDRILERAKRRSIEERGTRVELVYAWAETTNVTYFEVISGKLEFPEDVMSVDQVHQKQGDRFVIYDFTVTLVMYPFAYPVSPVTGTAIPAKLTNLHGSNVLTVQVDNRNDNQHDNFVEIDGNQLPGAYPLPITLNIVGDSGEGEKTGKIYIGVRQGDLDFVPILEDAASSFRIGNVGTTSDPDYSSGGTYSNLVHSATDPNNTKPPIQPAVLARWSLTDQQAEKTQGAFRIFGKVRDGSFWDQNANYALAICYQGVILHQTEWRTPLDTTISLFDFGTVFLPPWMGANQGLAGFDIELKIWRKIYGTTTVKLDYLALLPQDGGYRVLQYRGAGLAQLESVIDDGWGKSVYHLTTTGKRSGLPYALMPPLTLKPGVTQRLYFLMEGLNGSSEISRRLKLSVGVVPTYMVLS